ncbi:MAG: cation diffusion facilitator family transporter [Mesorhizobium sp.]|nr:cation diffusion facilitator family transporter [Mesorhizobium sp.]
MSAGQRVRRLALISIFVALVVVALKFWAWRITGSVALYSDALESTVNVIAALVAWYAIRVSFTPADDEHPFGHHKAEYLSAVAEGVLIVIAALLILREAVGAMLEPQPLLQANMGLAVSIVSTIINGVWAWVLIDTGRKERSPALVADARHIFSDVITSIGVVVGLLLALATGWMVLDPLLALIVALNILWQGWKLVNESIQGLMDRAAEPEDHARIERTILTNADGAIEIHDLKTRVAARATFIEFHMVVNAATSVGASHAICDRIEAALKAEIPFARIIIHVEPDHEAKNDSALTSAKL